MKTINLLSEIGDGGLGKDFNANLISALLTEIISDDYIFRYNVEKEAIICSRVDNSFPKFNISFRFGKLFATIMKYGVPDPNIGKIQMYYDKEYSTEPIYLLIRESIETFETIQKRDKRKNSLADHLKLSLSLDESKKKYIIEIDGSLINIKDDESIISAVIFTRDNFRIQYKTDVLREISSSFNSISEFKSKTDSKLKDLMDSHIKMNDVAKYIISEFKNHTDKQS